MRTKQAIILDELRTGTRTLAQLNQAVIDGGHTSTHANVIQTICNARRVCNGGHDIRTLGGGHYRLINPLPDGVRRNGTTLEIKGPRTAQWQPTQCTTAEAASLLRTKMTKAGVI